MLLLKNNMAKEIQVRKKCYHIVRFDSTFWRSLHDQIGEVLSISDANGIFSATEFQLRFVFEDVYDLLDVI